MGWGTRGVVVGAMAIALHGATGCASGRLLDRWDGVPSSAESVDGSAEDTWRRLLNGASAAELTVAGVDDATRTLTLEWITAPGAGTQYLRCGTGPVGSASVQPRIRVEADGASAARVRVSSLVRATAGAECVSNGSFERWILGRIGIVAGDAVVAAAGGALPR